jgi:hypothetical protein
MIGNALSKHKGGKFLRSRQYLIKFLMSNELPGFGVDEASGFRLVTGDIPIGGLGVRALEHNVEGPHRPILPFEPFLLHFCVAGVLSMKSPSPTSVKLGDNSIIYLNLLSLTFTLNHFFPKVNRRENSTFPPHPQVLALGHLPQQPSSYMKTTDQER